jgi:hypothetical protein
MRAERVLGTKLPNMANAAAEGVCCGAHGHRVDVRNFCNTRVEPRHRVRSGSHKHPSKQASTGSICDGIASESRHRQSTDSGSSACPSPAPSFGASAPGGHPLSVLHGERKGSPRLRAVACCGPICCRRRSKRPPGTADKQHASIWRCARSGHCNHSRRPVRSLGHPAP